MDLQYKIEGSDMQVLNVYLQPGEVVKSEPGLMLLMENGIEMMTATGGMMTGLKRMLGGGGFFITEFIQRGAQGSHVGFAAPYPGKIRVLDVDSSPEHTYLCQRDSFLCAEAGVDIEVAFTKRLGAGFFGGDGFVLQKICGQGLAFIHAGGTLIEKTLSSGEVLKVDTGAVVAFSSTVDYSVTMVRGIKNMLFGQEGVFLTRLEGPGTIYLQSLPFAKMAGRIATVLELGKK